MNSLMPFTTTATELQRNYKKVVRMVKKSKEPVTVLSNSRPEIIVMDYRTFRDFSRELPKEKARHRKGLDELFGSWTKEEGDEFDKIIEEEFEQINPEGWK